VSNAPKKPASLAAITASATRAERTAKVCVAGHLNAQYDDLEAQLVAIVKAADTDSLADGSADQKQAIAEEIEALRVEMTKHEHTFTFRALEDKVWSDLLLEHAPRDGKAERFNNETFPLPCTAACLVKINGEDATATVDELAPLWDILNVAQRDEMFWAAWQANTGTVSVPFSKLASAVRKDISEK
jgi:hypothetical protein